MVEPLLGYVAKLVQGIQTRLPVPVKRRIRQAMPLWRTQLYLSVTSQIHHAEAGGEPGQVEREGGVASTSGAFGLASPEDVISSAWDLRLAAFSTSNAASSGFPVARAKLNSAIA